VLALRSITATTDSQIQHYLVLLHYPPQNLDDGMGHNKHTDIGSITSLFTKQWGCSFNNLVLWSGSFVEPRDGHAIINIRDSLRFLSGKRFKSCLHRVVPVASDENRYSIAYFLRPENAAHLEDTEGRRIKAGEWHDQKYVMFGESHEKQAMSSMLTGGMERAIEIKA
jgi:isopenicillin N synthase-like dioxygenase